MDVFSGNNNPSLKFNKIYNNGSNKRSTMFSGVLYGDGVIKGSYADEDNGDFELV